WLGPAAQQPVRRQQFHYDWHWQWDFGNGDLGNQGVHQMDLCRWGVGQDRLPERTLSIGGRLGYDDDGQTPNTQLVWLGYEPAPILFEVRGLPDKTGSKEMDKYLGASIGVVFHCEHGVVVMDTYDSGYALDAKGQKVQEFKGGADHFANFVTAVRARDSKLLAADAQAGHLSAALCHLGNDSWRQGAMASADATAAAARDPQLGEAFGRMREHLGHNGIELATGSPLRLGKLLTVAADTRFTPREYRAGFALKA
ncbi:MAG TPA: gfo/Idh/MocA family oxidoreductase, partial [Planctomycetota bacterium]|nr:gfo/Idh/MocA family oxidoreductase [Planctomycetota bacterium]